MIDTTKLTPRACTLLGDILGQGGGLLDEHGICARTGLSHGYFSAARAELVEKGLLRVERVGRQACYVPLALGDAPTPAAEKDSKTADTARAVLTDDAPDYPRVTGCFGSFADWLDELAAQLGDVSADESGRVIIADTCTPQQYHLAWDEEGGLTVA